MPLSLRLILLHIAAPVAAGAALAAVTTWAPAKSAPEDEQSTSSKASLRRSITSEAPLPNDPELIRFAAMAGRTGPAREQLMAALAADASNGELATWLAAILIAEPAWLETFLKSVPEARRTNIVGSALSKLIHLDKRALWPVLRASPFAAALAKSQLSNYSTSDPFSSQPLIIEAAGYDPNGALDFILDPANGIPDSVLHHISPNDKSSATRMLNEWLSNHWPDESISRINSAWCIIEKEDPEALEKIREKLTAEQLTHVERMSWMSEFISRNPVEIPDATELATLNAEEVEVVRGELSAAGIPMPLELLAELTPDQRSKALRIQSMNLRDFTPEQVRAHIESLHAIPLLDTEKTMLLTGASDYLWKEAGDYQGALNLAAQISDPGQSTKITRNLLYQLAVEDPASAIQYSPDIGDEALRNEIIRIAEQNQP
ncbi:hypothetical protein ACFQY0_10110 [Haloferula chungangensis]|uniref:HEAT repeat domain-containing protein n=1 Tax=Haloferula chungangensis TaxID=1048331 RepID=A0ABW2L8M4_9BACT